MYCHSNGWGQMAATLAVNPAYVEMLSHSVGTPENNVPLHVNDT